MPFEMRQPVVNYLLQLLQTTTSYQTWEPETSHIPPTPFLRGDLKFHLSTFVEPKPGKLCCHAKGPDRPMSLQLVIKISKTSFLAHIIVHRSKMNTINVTVVFHMFSLFQDLHCLGKAQPII